MVLSFADKGFPLGAAALTPASLLRALNSAPILRLTRRAVGCALAAGYDSHESPNGGEWVLFHSGQVLPLLEVHGAGMAVCSIL